MRVWVNFETSLHVYGVDHIKLMVAIGTIHVCEGMCACVYTWSEHIEYMYMWNVCAYGLKNVDFCQYVNKKICLNWVSNFLHHSSSEFYSKSGSLIYSISLLRLILRFLFNICDDKVLCCYNAENTVTCSARELFSTGW